MNTVLAFACGFFTAMAIKTPDPIFGMLWAIGGLIALFAWRRADRKESEAEAGAATQIAEGE